MINLNAGELRYKITIQKLVCTEDSIGNDIESYQDLYTVWAGVNSLFGSEYWQASAQNQQNNIKFKIRWFKDLDNLIFDKELTKYRIVFNNHYFNIKSFDNIEFKNIIVIIMAQSI